MSSKKNNTALPKYQVFLLNDDTHSFEDVIKSLCDIFPTITTQQAIDAATTVHQEGKCLLVTVHLELAETYEAWLVKAGLLVKLEKV